MRDKRRDKGEHDRERLIVGETAMNGTSPELEEAVAGAAAFLQQDPLPTPSDSFSHPKHPESGQDEDTQQACHSLPALQAAGLPVPAHALEVAEEGFFPG